MYFQSMGLLKESESQSDTASKIPKKCCPVVSGKFSFWASTFFILNCLMGNWQKAHQLPTKSLQEQTKVFFFLSEPWVKSIRGKKNQTWLTFLVVHFTLCLLYNALHRVPYYFSLQWTSSTNDVRYVEMRIRCWCLLFLHKGIEHSVGISMAAINWLVFF